MNIEEIKISIANLFGFADETVIKSVELGDDPEGAFIVLTMTTGKVFHVIVKEIK